MGKGIDYGNGLTNIDQKTGIRYGVINQHEVLQVWADSSEAFYIYHCPHCGSGPLKKGQDAKRCPSCYKSIDPDNDFDCMEPSSFYYREDGYLCEQGNDDMDIFIIKSPYFTYCQYCSPCAPGAGYLMWPDKDGVKAYCFGHDWFEDEKAPYPVYDVKTGELIEV